jgi:hypothetical protein
MKSHLALIQVWNTQHPALIVLWSTNQYRCFGVEEFLTEVY